MAWQGGKLHGGQRKRPVFLLTLIFILASACAALGMSLYGAKLAHTRLWERLQDQELTILKMQQSMAEVKVEAVDNLSSKNDLTTERDFYKQEQQSALEAVREREAQLTELQSHLEAAEARVTELERRLSNRQTEAHVLKKALDQYKHQIANLTQELDILRSRMKRAGLIQEAHSVLPHSNVSGNGVIAGAVESGDETLKAFEAEQARMVASEEELGLHSRIVDADEGDNSMDSRKAAKTMTDDANLNSNEVENTSSRDALLRVKAEEEAAAATRAL